MHTIGGDNRVSIGVSSGGGLFKLLLHFSRLKRLTKLVLFIGDTFTDSPTNPWEELFSDGDIMVLSVNFGIYFVYQSTNTPKHK
jgi:hypothetical protein